MTDIEKHVRERERESAFLFQRLSVVIRRFNAILLTSLFFKAASLDGHMAFLVDVHYVIFYWKFCMQVWRTNSSSSSSSSPQQF